MNHLTYPQLNQELERISIAGIYCLNARDFSLSTPSGLEVRKYFAPNFRVVLDHLSSTPLTWEEACTFLSTFFAENPEAQYAVRNVSSDVDAKKGVATVWFELVMEGKGDGVRESGMGTCVWRKGLGEGEGWVWGRYWNMRGMEGNLGFV